MKFTLTVVRDEDASEVVEALVGHDFYVTRMASSGGFLRAGNTVLLCGVEDDRVDEMLEVIRAHSNIRVHPPSSRNAEETEVSRAVVFVLGMERLEKL